MLRRRATISLWLELAKSKARRGEGVWHIPVETQNFTEDENQDHADKNPGLVHVRPDALVADDTNAVPSSEPRQSDRQPAGKMHDSTISLVSRRCLDGW